MECNQYDIFYLEPEKTKDQRQDDIFWLSIGVFALMIISFLWIEIYLRVKHPDPEIKYFNYDETSESYHNEPLTEEELKLQNLTIQNTQFNAKVGKLKLRTNKNIPSIDNALKEKDNNIWDFQTKYSFPRSNKIMHSPQLVLFRSKSVKKTIKGAPNLTFWVTQKTRSPISSLSTARSDDSSGEEPPANKKRVRFSLWIPSQTL